MANELLTREDIARGKKNFDAFNEYLDGHESKQVTLPSGKKIKTRAGIEKELKEKFPDNKAGMRYVGTEVGDVAVMTRNGVSSTGWGATAAKAPIPDATKLSDYKKNAIFGLPSSVMTSYEDSPDNVNACMLESTTYDGDRYVSQTLRPLTSNELYFRTCWNMGQDSEVISPWAELYHTQNSKPYRTTTATAANVVVTSTGELQRSTSSRLFKDDIKAIDITDYRQALRGVQPVSYRSTSATADRTDWHWYSFIAEDLANVDPALVNMSNVEFFEDTDEDGNTFINTRELPDGEYAPDGLNLNGIVAMMARINQYMLDDIEDLEKEKTQLKTRMTKLENRLAELEKLLPAS